MLTSREVQGVMVATQRPLFETPEPLGRDSTCLRGVLTADEFARACRVGTEWVVSIRTATVRGRVIDRAPLGTLAESFCLEVTFKLARPVPIEPGLRFRVAALDDPDCLATGVVGPMDLSASHQGGDPEPEAETGVGLSS
jgi:hypothetical protein